MTCSTVAVTGPSGRIEHAAPPPVQLTLDEHSPAVFLCSAIHHEGVQQLAAHLRELTAKNTAAWQARRKEQALHEVRLGVIEAIVRRVKHEMDGEQNQTRLREVLSGDFPLERLADELMHAAMKSPGERN